MVAIVILIALLGAGIGYSIWLKNGVKPRQFRTRMAADEVRLLFVQKVARAGWTVVDDGNPMVAQSPLLTGVRQQIALRVSADANGLAVDVRPVRLQVKLLTRTPTKGHTLRLRMNSFVTAVHAQDPTLQLSAAS